jgi:SSS family solute:Na+ symporter
MITLIGLFTGVYSYMAWQGNQGFNASALNPHEARMGRILGQWRGYASTVMVTLLALCAYVFMHHPDFAGTAGVIQSRVAAIGGGEMIQKQMTVPVALSLALPTGIKGMFLAIMIFAMMAADTSYMHSWGSIFIQDVLLPFRKKHLTPEAHIRLLRWSIAGVALFAFCFSLLFRQTEYIFMYFAITGAIYLGGAGSVIIGGLYWNRGTTAAAWSAMIVGSGLAVGFIVLRQVNPAFPLNGQVLGFLATLAAIATYVTVSLLTCRSPHDMDKLLHRGKYAVDADGVPLPEVAKPPRTWQTLIGIDEKFRRGDRIQSITLFIWSMGWFVVFIVITLWNLLSRWPVDWWWNYLLVTGIILPLIIGVITTTWFGWGGLRDLGRLFRRLSTAKRDASDDGEVVKENL